MKSEIQKPIVVVGAGIGGISAAYHLAKAGSKVLLLEASQKIGGHACAVPVRGLSVDIGFLMYGDSQPELKAWFKELGLTREDGSTGRKIPMSLSVVSDVPELLNFSTRAPFHERFSLFNGKLWGILLEIHRFTRDLIQSPPTKSSLTVRQWMDRREYSQLFYENYFIPFISILWNIPYKDLLELPVHQFLITLSHHAKSLYVPLSSIVLRTLKLSAPSPEHVWWYMGSRYLAAFEERFSSLGGEIRVDAPVARVDEGGGSVELRNGERIVCENVILATHAPTSCKLLSWSTKASELARYRTHPCRLLVHSDHKFLPEDRKQWASWNVRVMKNKEYALTYWLNRIQNLGNEHDYFVTILHRDTSPEFLPRQDKVYHEVLWEHPIQLADGLNPETLVREPGIFLSGAWLGMGFHADGLEAGRRAAESLLKARKT